MNKFKLTTLAAALLFSSLVNAEYTIKVPLEVAQGGTLPNGSIKFKTNTPAEPPILNCTATGISAECDERLSAWETFANDRGLIKTWSNIGWVSRSLTFIPEESYPVSSAVNIIFANNQLTSVNGFRNIQSISGSLNLSNNNLNNISGLKNLQSASGSLNLSINNLNDISSLSNLQTVGTLDLSTNALNNVNGLNNLATANNINLQNNPALSNISGLQNLRKGTVYIDVSYSGAKLPASSNFCSYSQVVAYNSSNAATKAQLCETDTSEESAEESAWATFANSYSGTGLALNKDWNNLSWSIRGLVSIPSSNYPLTVVNSINLLDNQLTDLSGLSNITHIGNLSLQINELTNLDGLSGLTTAGDLVFFNNNLTDVDGLINLTSANLIALQDNLITSLNGLSNVQVAGKIKIDGTYAGPKLSAATRFCTLNNEEAFINENGFFASKSQVCETP